MSLLEVANIDSSCAISDTNDINKKIQFDVSNISPGNTILLSIPITNTTLIGNNNIDTITNKTIDANNNTILNISNTNI
jgi:hypothetical protein